MKRFFLFLLVAVLVVVPAAADEIHKDPAETFAQALNKLPNGGTLFLQGVIDTYEQKIKVMNRHYTEASPLVIDGQGKTVSMQPVDFSDCGWVVLKGVECYGGMGLNNTVPDAEKCLQHVTVEDCVFRYGRIFAGGYTYHDITLRNCVVQEVIYSGQETHGIYFSGGHWTGGIGLPHPSKITIEGCTIRWAGGRHGIQVNGCFDGVKLLGNTIYCTAFTGFQGIGIHGCEVAGNTIFLGNRGCINIYDYADQWGTWSKEYVENWRQVHHPNDHWNIHHNTFVVGPTEWCWWQNKSYVKGRPCILFNNEMAGAEVEWPDGTVTDLDYEPTVHWVHDNVLVSPWANIIQFDELWSVAATHVTGNLVYTYEEGMVPLVTLNPDAVDPGEPTAYTFAAAESLAPPLYSGNTWDVDPKFAHWPDGFPHASEIPPFNHLYPPDASYDWSMWPGKFDLFSNVAKKMGKGALTEGRLWVNGKWVQRGAKKVFGAGAGKMGPKGEGAKPMEVTPKDLREMIERGK